MSPSTLAPTLSSAGALLAASSSASTDAIAATYAAALAAAGDTSAVVASVPLELRGELSPLLWAVHERARRSHELTKLVASWDLLSSKGEYPPQFSVKAPAVQFSKAFASSDKGKEAVAGLRKSHQDFLTSSFKLALTDKKDELLFVRTTLTPEALWTEFSTSARGAIKEARTAHRIPEVSFENLWTDESEMDVDAGPEVKWVEDPSWRTAMEGFLTALVQFPLRVIALASVADLASAKKDAKKRELAATAATTQGDFKIDRKSIEKLVSEAVAKSSKVAPADSDKKKPPPKTLKFKKNEAKGKGAGAPAKSAATGSTSTAPKPMGTSWRTSLMSTPIAYIPPPAKKRARESMGNAGGQGKKPRKG